MTATDKAAPEPSPEAMGISVSMRSVSAGKRSIPSSSRSSFSSDFRPLPSSNSSKRLSKRMASENTRNSSPEGSKVTVVRALCSGMAMAGLL